MLECSFFALQAFPDATWAYADVVGFGSMKYLDSKIFDIEKMKVDNQITATALIRKEKILELGGYGIANRYVNEDWHLWLRMLQKGYYPVHMHFYGLWYRRKESKSLLKEVNDPKNPNNKLRLEELKKEADKINKVVKAVELPGYNRKIQKLEINFENWNTILKDENNILIITNKLTTDPHIFEIIEREEGKSVTIITTESSPYIGRQAYESKAEVFDTTTFLPTENQVDFVNYIIKTRNINKIYLCNKSDFEEKIDKGIKTVKINYTEDNSNYLLMKKKYKFRKTLLGRIIYKIRRIIGLD